MEPNGRSETIPRTGDFGAGRHAACPWPAACHGPVFVRQSPGPPVIIHGGSLHAAVKGETYDPELKTLTVPVKDVSKVTLAGYKKPPKLGTEWAMQICNEDPCIHGMVMNAKAGSISISLINPKDLIAKGRKSIYGQTDYELIGTGGSDEYYPEYLSIKENGATTKYNCVTDPSGDWTSCRIQIGARQK